MIVEMREYTLHAGKVPEYLQLYEREGLSIQREILGHMVGYYTTEVGPAVNQIVHLWAYESLADYEARSRARDAHPDFPAYLQASAHLITAQETRLIRAADLPSARSLMPRR